MSILSIFFFICNHVIYACVFAYLLYNYYMNYCLFSYHMNPYKIEKITDDDLDNMKNMNKIELLKFIRSKNKYASFYVAGHKLIIMNFVPDKYIIDFKNEMVETITKID